MSPFNTEDKTFRIMRLTFIALFVFSFSLLASVHSQTMRININANNESTHSILEQIEQQTDYLFIYNTNEIDLNRKASVHAQDQTVMDVLSQIFRNTNIGYAIEGSNIMLMKKDEKAEQQQDNNKVSGTITDKSGEPIIGANVVIKGTTNGTITDIDGNYTLDVPVSAILQISYIGYLTQDVPVNGKQTNQYSFSRRYATIRRGGSGWLRYTEKRGINFIYFQHKKRNIHSRFSTRRSPVASRKGCGTWHCHA